MFFLPGREILVAHNSEDAVAALDLSDVELKRIGTAARDRTLAEHTSAHRAAELIDILASARMRAATASLAPLET
jgi:spore maturation protein CgeB